MIKKHLIPLAIITTLIVMANVFAYMQSELTTDFKKDTTTINEKINLVKVAEAPVFSLDELHFAEETLPEGDTKVNKKMRKVLSSFSYKKLKTSRLHNKAKTWFPVIEPVLAAYGIPNDFKYIPLVESGLTDGTSPKGAAGFWQLMPNTARRYGLTVNDKIDERKNLHKSTIAACRYLKELYRIFNGWTLVAAAYNVGETHLQKQINRQNQDNYYKMKLNNETSGYVYKLISVKEILENPMRNGYKKQKPLFALDIQNKQKDTPTE